MAACTQRETAVELSVLIQQTAGNGYRAWCGEPFPAEAEGATREEALNRLRAALEVKIESVELVRIYIHTPLGGWDPPGTGGDEQSDDPEAVSRWIEAFEAIPPLQMSAAEEAEWRATRTSRKCADLQSIEQLAASLQEEKG
jgi:predicted RNase H-like HicB family nuclease